MGPSGLIVILLDRRRFRVRTFLAIGFKISTLYLIFKWVLWQWPWRTAEMEFLNNFFSQGSGHKLESSHSRAFVWFSTFVFPFYKNALHENTWVFLFLHRFFKTRLGYGLFNWCLRIPSQEEIIVAYWRAKKNPLQCSVGWTLNLRESSHLILKIDNSSRIFTQFGWMD